MKKILAFVLFLVGFSMAGAFAAEELSFPEIVEPGDIIVNGSIGLTNSFALYGRGTTLVPPLSLSAEYALPIVIPLSVGAVIGFASNERKGGDGDAKYTYTWSVFSIGARAAYHFNWSVEGLDTYAALTIGANFLTPQTEYNASAYTGNSKPSAGDSETTFLFGVEFGARFFFTKYLGVFIEEGFNTFTYVRSGLVFKF